MTPNIFQVAPERCNTQANGTQHDLATMTALTFHTASCCSAVIMDSKPTLWRCCGGVMRRLSKKCKGVKPPIQSTPSHWTSNLWPSCPMKRSSEFTLGGPCLRKDIFNGHGYIHPKQTSQCYVQCDTSTQEVSSWFQLLQTAHCCDAGIWWPCRESTLNSSLLCTWQHAPS